MRDAPLALICTIVVSILGRILHYIRDKYGLIAAILAHLGGDAGICVVAFQVASHFM